MLVFSSVFANNANSWPVQTGYFSPRMRMMHRNRCDYIWELLDDPQSSRPTVVAGWDTVTDSTDELGPQFVSQVGLQLG